MELGFSFHLDFNWSGEQTIKLKVGELYSRCIIVTSNTLLKVLFGIQIINSIQNLCTKFLYDLLKLCDRKIDINNWKCWYFSIWIYKDHNTNFERQMIKWLSGCRKEGLCCRKHPFWW